jgi:hypothetical protein
VLLSSSGSSSESRRSRLDPEPIGQRICSHSRGHGKSIMTCLGTYRIISREGSSQERGLPPPPNATIEAPAGLGLDKGWYTTLREANRGALLLYLPRIDEACQEDRGGELLKTPLVLRPPPYPAHTQQTRTLQFTLGGLWRFPADFALGKGVWRLVGVCLKGCASDAELPRWPTKEGPRFDGDMMPSWSWRA